MGSLPGGTLTFLFTDIEASSSRWESRPIEMDRALVLHDQVLADEIQSRGGELFKHTGDGVCAVFTRPRDALDAAIASQRRLQTEPWIAGDRLLVRMGLHTGEVEPRDGDYFGPVVNRAARVMAVANGDQIAVSAATAALAEGVRLQDEGDHELRGIGVERIHLVWDAELVIDPRPLRRPASSARNLPVVLTRMIGREADQRDIAELVRTNRLVTLLGVGGVGKTRLAIEVAGGLADAFPGGVRFCELAPVADGAAVVDAVAEAVGARPQPGLDLASSIADYVGSRDMLLVLDNCEHVIEATRRLVTSLLAVDGVSVLATSRESLHMPAERLWPVEPFADADHGVQLFVDRALERDAGFSLDEASEPYVREICRRLDDIPLAIELAAARVRVLSLAQLAQRLDDRFSLLKGRQHGDRQTTLRETVQWSYDLLRPAERQLFGRLSVFAGTFSLASVEAVCGPDESEADDLVDQVDGLVDKSMVVSHGVGGRMRFSMLETLRQFASLQLDDDPAAAAVRRRHEEHFCAVAARQHDALFGPREDDAWQTFSDEWDNLRAAYESARDRGDVSAAAELVIAVAWFAVLSIRNEAFGWARELLDTPGVDTIDQYPSLCGVVGMGAYLTVEPAAEELAERGLALEPRDPHGFCRSTLCAVYLNNFHMADASDRVTADWVTLLDDTDIGNQLWAHGFRAFYVASYGGRAGADEAALHAERVMELANQTGSTSARALAHWAGALALSVTDPARALERLQLGLSTASSLSSEHLLGHLIVGLQLHFGAERGELVEMLQLCRMAVSDALEQHYFTGASHALGVSAIVLTRAGDAHTAGRLLGAMVANGHLPRHNAVGAVTDALGDEYDAVTASGASMSAQAGARLAIDAIDGALAAVGSPS